jgi:hypothetical protein
VSGSAPLPLRLFDDWRELAGEPRALSACGVLGVGQADSRALHFDRDRNVQSGPPAGQGLYAVAQHGVPCTPGQPLLERYGMTEAGMLLSNPLHGERRPGR